MSQKTAPLRAPALCGNRSSADIRQPSTVSMRQPGLQSAIDTELYLTRSNDLTPDPKTLYFQVIYMF